MEQAFRLQALSALAGRYDVVYADPPWPHYGDPNKDAAAGKHYSLMSLEEICALPIKSLFRTKQGALFLWATSARLELGIDAIRAWGMHFRGVAFNWVKTTQAGSIIHGQGVPPTGTKPTSEFCLLATTRRTGRPFPLLNSAMGQVVLHARGRHSEKPAVIREKIVTLYGDRPRIELFARERVVGWDFWGDDPKLDDGAFDANVQSVDVAQPEIGAAGRDACSGGALDSGCGGGR